MGDEDPVVAPEVVREVQALVSGSEYREFAGAGHSVYWEQPDEFNEVLNTYLAEARQFGLAIASGDRARDGRGPPRDDHGLHGA